MFILLKFNKMKSGKIKELELKNSHEPEFIQAVEEVVEAVIMLPHSAFG